MTTTTQDPTDIAARQDAPQSRGRPRDPGLEPRVFDAAIALYAEAGWTGFNFDAVAKRAGVGKAAIYRRWPNRGELLHQTLEARWYDVERIDTGSLRGDLLALAMVCLKARTGPHSGTALHLLVDSARFPEIRAATTAYAEDMIRQGRGVVRRAIGRGEIPGSINPGLIMDVVVGGVTNHIATTPERLRPAMIDKMDSFAETLVDLVLKGVRA